MLFGHIPYHMGHALGDFHVEAAKRARVLQAGELLIDSPRLGEPRRDWPRVRCARRDVAIVDPGARLSGTTGWTGFSLTIDIPPACDAQWLTLAAPGAGPATGEAWFDDLKITR